MALTLTNFSSYSPDYKFSFTNTEYDLSEYQNKLASRRDENSLFLRRLGLHGMKSSSNKSYNASLGDDFSSLISNKLILKESLESRDSDQIISLYNEFSGNEKRQLPILASDEQIIDSLTSAFNSLDDFSIEAKPIVFDIIKSIVTISSDNVITKIIDEIGFTLSTLVTNSLDEIETNFNENGSENSIILPFALELIRVFTKFSFYSRSTMISFGILYSIMQIALKDIDNDLTNQCLIVIRSILTKRQPKHNNRMLKSPSFSTLSQSEYGMGSRRIRSTRSTPSSLVLNQNTLGSNNDSAESEYYVDVNDVENIIDPLFELLHLKIDQYSDFTSISNIISIFVELTNILPILIKRFYNNGLFEFALKSITVPELTKSCINLIGNLPASSSLTFTQNMINLGLFDKLMELIQNAEFTSDVFWVLSNFLDVISQCVIPLITSELITLSVEIASQSPFNIKREIAYFLSSLIIIMDSDDIVNFLVSEEIVELLAEMLNSGVEDLMIKCICAFQKILGIAVQLNSAELNCDILFQMFDSYDVVKQLNEIVQQIDQKNTTLISTASRLLFDIQSIIEDQQ